MSERSRDPRVLAGVLAALLSLATLTSLGAQQAPPPRGQSPGPRFIVPTLRSNAQSLGFTAAEAIRDRLASDFNIRTLWVVPESTITKFLESSGYPPRQSLNANDTRQLAAQFRADEYINGSVVRTPTGAFRAEIDWALPRLGDLVQPLPPVEASKISEIAKLLSQEFQAARRQVESVRRCLDLTRAKDYDGAMAEARKAIAVYQRSALARVCMAGVYQERGFGPDSMIRISEEVLAIDPRNRRALEYADRAYEAKGMGERVIEVRKDLLAQDPGSPDRMRRFIEATVKYGKPSFARPYIEAAVQQNPGEPRLLDLQWRTYLALQEWTAAIATGGELIRVDSSAATADFFVRMAAALSADKQPAKAAEMAARGAAKFSDNDELAVLQVQLLRSAGRLQESREAAERLAARNPRAPNVWLQKARTQVDLRHAPDSVIATLRRGVENGESKVVVSGYAATLGQAAAKQDTIAGSTAGIRVALAYYKFADATQTSDTVAFLLGATSVSFGQRLAAEARDKKRCDLVKEARAAFVDAAINLPRGGRAFPEQARQGLGALQQLIPYGEQLEKALCK